MSEPRCRRCGAPEQYCVPHALCRTIGGAEYANHDFSPEPVAEHRVCRKCRQSDWTGDVSPGACEHDFHARTCSVHAAFQPANGFPCDCKPAPAPEPSVASVIDAVLRHNLALYGHPNDPDILGDAVAANDAYVAAGSPKCINVAFAAAETAYGNSDRARCENAKTIARLEAELKEARKDAERWRKCIAGEPTGLSVLDQMEKERDAARAELAEARKAFREMESAAGKAQDEERAARADAADARGRMLAMERLLNEKMKEIDAALDGGKE